MWPARRIRMKAKEHIWAEQNIDRHKKAYLVSTGSKGRQEQEVALSTLEFAETIEENRRSQKFALVLQVMAISRQFRAAWIMILQKI